MRLPRGLARVCIATAGGVALMAGVAAPATLGGRAVSASILPNGVSVMREVAHVTTPPLRSIHAVPTTGTQTYPVRHAANFPGRAPASTPSSARDTSGQHRVRSPHIPSTSVDFTGIGNLDGVLPPDTNGAVGPTQYAELINSHFAVYSKTGATLLAPETTNTLWTGLGGGCQTNNNGDGMVIYDAMSGRWVAQQFSVSAPLPYLECIAVSATGDATGSWHAYAFQTPAQDSSGNGFPDYPKMGVWPDAYYITYNMFNGPGTAGQGTQACAYDRTRMIAGQPATQQCVLVTGAHAAPLDDDTVLPASVEGSTAPPAGSPEYLLSAPQVVGSQSTLNTWTYHVDWTTPANSALSARTSLAVSPYTMPCFSSSGGNRDCVPQGGSTQRLDAVADRLMSRLSYRNLGTRQSLVVDESIVAGSSIGMRWYEFTPSGGVLSVVQQGTVAPDANYRWMGSISEDKSGDIAMGYSVSSSSIAPQIRYSGRLVGDPAGTMPQGEGNVALTGSGAQTIGNRWGDYTSMTVDPGDDCTFWYADEFGLSSGDWSTQIASFKFPSCGGTVTNDFSISAAPPSLSVAQGQSGTSTISTAVTSGSAQTVNLTASGAPAGVTATLNPTSVTAGSSSTLTLSASSTAAPGTYTITVTGTGTSATHSTTVSLTVTAATGGNNFSISASPSSLSVAQGQSGTSTISTAVTSGSAQTVNLTASGAPAGVTATLNPTSVTAGGSSTLTLAVSSTAAPGTYTITVTGTGPSATHSTTVSLTVTSSGGGGGNVVVNGGFETGTFSGWTTSGTTAISNTAHTGAHSAQLGGTTPTNGDSTIKQTVTVPSAGTLSFWYKMTCPDTVTYDWATVQVVNTSNAVLTTPLAKTCATNSAFVQVSASLSAYAGTSVQLVFTSHDDNYSADPSYTLFDDISLTGTTTTNDFTIAANPASLSVVQGSSGSVTISTTVKSGSAQSVNLSASGVPAGASASFNPTSVTAGGSSTMTIATSASTPAGTYTVTVTGTGASATHTTTVSLTVTPAGGGSAVTNGGFETGNLNGWTADGVAPPTVTTVQKHSGTYAAQLGAISTPEPNGDSSLTQQITVPSGTSSLSFWYWPSTTDTVTYDWQEAQIRNTSGATLAQVFKVASNAQAWTQVTFDMTPYAGTSVQLYFNDHQDGYGDLTYFYLDDVAVSGGGGPPPPSLVQVSSDPYTNSSSEHATQVEPDTFSNGSTIVSAFQTGRFNDGGSDDIGWATSTNGGATWSHGQLPGITTFTGGGTWSRVSDPSVAYDARHGVWLISGLTIDASATGRGVSVNRSTDGINWQPATNAISQTADFFDKDWIVCDSTSTSPHYGNCYIEFDDNSLANTVQMLTSTDGGVTWSSPAATADTAHGLGGQPLVQPNGTVVVPYLDDGAAQIRSFTSTNGGSTWNSSTLISAKTEHAAAGGFRTSALPSAEIDASGNVFVAWQDCRFRSGCPANDIVMATSANGTQWSAVSRIPIDPTTSGSDHFVPGLGVDRTTGGSSAHLGLYYYYYPSASCTTCSLSVGFVSSANAGSSWSAPTQVAGPFALTTIAPTTQGPMVGDYISTSFLGGRAWSVFAVGVPASGTLNEGMYTLSGGLRAHGGNRHGESWGSDPVPTAAPFQGQRSATAY